MTLRENAAVLETYLHNIRNIEEMPPGPVELDALDAAVETMKAAVENVEYGAFAWDKQRGMFVQIGRSVPVVFMGELWSGCKYPDEVIDWMKSNYEIESCLTAEVYRSSLGDCTNNGISSYARELYILDTQKGPFEPDDIRQCVYIEKREVMGQEYVDCKPAYCRKRWYMAGGNILYTSDSRFKQITGISYPIAIHDRYEGR